MVLFTNHKTTCSFWNNNATKFLKIFEDIFEEISDFWGTKWRYYELSSNHKARSASVSSIKLKRDLTILVIQCMFRE